MKNKFAYQDIAADKVLTASYDMNFIAAVLASAPNSGKTCTSQKILNKFFKKHPNSKALVITHGQGVLKDQYLSDLKTPNVTIDFTFGELNTGSQVEVCLFQNYKDVEGEYDLVIIDEAHQFYKAEMSQKLLAKTNYKYLILMTGTPSFFNDWNKENNRKYFVHYVSASEISNNAELQIDFIKTNSDDTDHVIKAMISKMKHYNTDKVMIACKTIEQAHKVSKALSSRKVVISTASDSSNQNIQDFVAGKFDTLIVVKKGILGFNDPMITMAIDLKDSDSTDVTYQYLARVLRQHPNGIVKTYLRVANKATWNESVTVMKKVTSLVDKKEFRDYSNKKTKAVKSSEWGRVSL